MKKLIRRHVALAIAAMVFFFFMFGQSALADIPNIPKYPDKLTGDEWNSHKDLGAKIIGKKENIRGMRSAMGEAEKARAKLNPYAYQVEKDLLADMTKQAVSDTYKNIVKKQWQADKKVLTDALDDIIAIGEKYSEAIKASKTISKKSRKYIDEVVAEAKDYKGNINDVSDDAVIAALEESSLDQRSILTGEKYVAIAQGNMDALKRLAKTVKTKSDWVDNKVQSQYIRGVGTVSKNMKKMLGEEILALWKTYSSDPWQPEADENVEEKWTLILKLIQDTEAKMQ